MDYSCSLLGAVYVVLGVFAFGVMGIGVFLLIAGSSTNDGPAIKKGLKIMWSGIALLVVVMALALINHAIGGTVCQ